MSDTRQLPLLPIITIAAFVIIIVALVAWFKPEPTESAVTTPQAHDSLSTTESDLASSDVEAPGSVINSTDRTLGFVTGLEDMPRSLQDTEVDGEIIIDDDRQLVVTEGLRRLFDYFLSASGEEDDAAILARVAAYIRHHTPEPAASQAVAIFEQYVAYLKAIPELEKTYGNLQLRATKSGELDLDAIAQKKQDIADLRRQFFDEATIEAFFAADDEYDAYNLALMTIEQDPQLTATQKAAAREDYISRLPDNNITQSIQQQAILSDLITRTEQMTAEGATPDALFEMRRELVGEAAATRLAKLDDENADFDRRFEQYQAQKQLLAAQLGVSSQQEQVDTATQSQLQQQITALETQLFSPAERKRLSGYEALKQAESSSD